MIHEACITICCLPMTNEGIEEIYVYADKVIVSGQNQISVYLFPANPKSLEFEAFKLRYKNNQNLINFWTNLEPGHQKFEKDLKPLSYSVDKKGKHVFD